MYICLYRNKPQGSAITGRLVIDGRWFCNTLERVGYEIPALCYHVCVTQSPRFKRLLPIVQNVPQRSGIRIHRGSKPEHSSGCVLVVADNKDTVIQQPKQLNPTTLRANQLPGALKGNIGCRTAADVENKLTQLLLKAQNDHEEIILEVTDFRPGTEYGYNHPCEPELQKP